MKQERGSKTLIEEMKKYLPIPARFTKEAYKYLSQEKRTIDMSREVNISSVFDSGDAGGIVCAIEGDEKEVLVISLTHLIVKPDHPLSDKIVAYQKKRIRRLQRYG
ncbi:MAG TPA: hypothetical protein VN278_02435 [Methanosarcina sp.]|nr:hypothetical protein [Methanosarcina sp.]